MTDLEMTKLCAEAMGLDETVLVILGSGLLANAYDPLHNDGDALALVKKLRLQIDPYDDVWNVGGGEGSGGAAQHENLNRAIVECVAKMQQAKK